MGDPNDFDHRKFLLARCHLRDLLSLVKRYEQEKLYWNCSIHGQSQNAWGCPECLRELRESRRKYETTKSDADDSRKLGKI